MTPGVVHSEGEAGLWSGCSAKSALDVQWSEPDVLERGAENRREDEGSAAGRGAGVGDDTSAGRERELGLRSDQTCSAGVEGPGEEAPVDWQTQAARGDSRVLRGAVRWRHRPIREALVPSRAPSAYRIRRASRA